MFDRKVKFKLVKYEEKSLDKNSNALFKIRILFILTFAILAVISKTSKTYAFDAYRNRHLFELNVAKELVLEADKIEAIKTSIIIPESSPCYYKKTTK